MVKKIKSKNNVIHESLAKSWSADKIGKIFITDEFFRENKKIILKEYLSELLDPIDSDEHDIFHSQNNDRKFINIRDDIFEVEIDPSRVLIGFSRFSFKRVKSGYMDKPKFLDNKDFSKELEKFEYGLSNSAGAIKVLKTLQSIMLTFIKRNNPRGISFKDYDEGLREKTYSYMAKKLCKASGYFLLEANHYFFLFKNKKDMLEIKQDMGL